MAGIFGDETIRLLREKWPNASLLAEELFAMFTATEPINIPAGSTLQPTSGLSQTYLNVPDFTEGDSIFNITGKHGQAVGSLTISDGTPTFVPPSGVVPPKKKTPPAPASAFPGQVQGQVSGSIYNVDTYQNGPAGGITSVEVTQLFIDPSEVIPPGTWTLVSKTPDGTYSMQVPVWGTPT